MVVVEVKRSVKWERVSRIHNEVLNTLRKE
jgi:hypothetical protein